MIKANGKFCAISMVQFQDVTILVICSKGVHKFCLIDELDRFIDTESGLISRIARAFRNQYSKLTENQKTNLISRLTSGFTIIGEYNDGKHISFRFPKRRTNPTLNSSVSPRTKVQSQKQSPLPEILSKIWWK